MNMKQINTMRTVLAVFVIVGAIVIALTVIVRDVNATGVYSMASWAEVGIAAAIVGIAFWRIFKDKHMGISAGLTVLLVGIAAGVALLINAAP